ncbi:MAG: transposase zinc-binding domain-containing protein [Cyanobacteriota bacterium]
MITLSHLIERYQPELERLHGEQLLPSHRQALRAMRRCRRQSSEKMLLECQPCGTTMQIPHSCGHRSCPHCQHHDSQQWIERQSAKLLPAG